MKKLVKLFAGLALLLFTSTQLFADPPKRPAAPAGSNTVNSSLAIVEAFQNVFRSVSDTMLPAVVEVDVKETKTVQDPFSGMGWPFGDFFGNGNQNDKDGKNIIPNILGSYTTFEDRLEAVLRAGTINQNLEQLRMNRLALKRGMNHAEKNPKMNYSNSHSICS